MFGRRRIFLVVASLALAGLALAPAVSAAPPAPRAVPVSCQSVFLGQAYDREFPAGPTYHLRGWTGAYASTGSPLCDGTTYVLPSHIDFSMGLGVVQGRDQYVLSGIDGGWIGTYTQHWAYPDAITYGTAVAHGYGALEGWQLRTHLVEYLDGTIGETGYAFPPGD